MNGKYLVKRAKELLASGHDPESAYQVLLIEDMQQRQRVGRVESMAKND